MSPLRHWALRYLLGGAAVYLLFHLALVALWHPFFAISPFSRAAPGWFGSDRSAGAGGVVLFLVALLTGVFTRERRPWPLPLWAGVLLGFSLVQSVQGWGNLAPLVAIYAVIRSGPPVLVGALVGWAVRKSMARPK